MAEGRSYGDRLRDARERQGIDLVSMARALHIRPDIVRAIESADFRKMPAHGYSKNMVRAYARKVGLDEEAISSQYLAEREHGERGGAQRNRRPSRSDRPAPARSRSISSNARSGSKNALILLSFLYIKFIHGTGNFILHHIFRRRYGIFYCILHTLSFFF